MLKKRFLFTLIFVFMFMCTNVNAEMLCSYEQENTGRTIDLDVKSSSVTVYQNGEKISLDINFNILDRDVCPSKIYTALSTGAIYSMQNEYNSLIELKLINSSAKKVSCGNITQIPRKIPELTSMAITMIQIVVPVILVIMGSIDLFKGITAQKEDEIKKGQQLFIKRLIVAALIFFIIVIAKVLVSVVAESSSENIVECIDCFLSGVENCK